MEIVKKTSNNLTLKTENSLAFHLIKFGMVFAGFALLMMLGILLVAGVENRNKFVLFLLPFMAFGFMIIYWGASSIKTCKVNKNIGILTIKGWTWQGNKIVEYKHREIADVCVEENLGGDEAKFYKLFIVLKSGDRLVLSNTPQQQQQKEIADLIRSYLNLPPMA